MRNDLEGIRSHKSNEPRLNFALDILIIGQKIPQFYYQISLTSKTRSHDTFYRIFCNACFSRAAEGGVGWRAKPGTNWNHLLNAVTSSCSALNSELVICSFHTRLGIDLMHVLFFQAQMELIQSMHRFLKLVEFCR